jgi:hypothetical protein
MSEYVKLLEAIAEILDAAIIMLNEIRWKLSEEGDMEGAVEVSFIKENIDMIHSKLLETIGDFKESMKQVEETKK